MNLRFPLLAGLIIMLMTPAAVIAYTVRHLPPSGPAPDTCVKVDLQHDDRYSSMTGRIRRVDKDWVSLYGLADSNRQEDTWIPISNVAMITPADGCSSSK